MARLWARLDGEALLLPRPWTERRSGALCSIELGKLAIEAGRGFAKELLGVRESGGVRSGGLGVAFYRPGAAHGEALWARSMMASWGVLSDREQAREIEKARACLSRVDRELGVA